MAVTDDMRRRAERFKPTADMATAERTEFMRLNVGSGLPIAQLQRIYISQRRHAQRGQLKRQVDFIYGFPPFDDDHETDLAWACDHPGREFRVRPWRRSDGEPLASSLDPCVTVIHMFSGEALVGIPHSFIERAGLGHVRPHDCDDYGLLLFLVQRASNNWRDKMPERAA